MTDMETRVDRLDTMIEEGRIIRGAWTEGHERACLLAALSPEAGRAGYASACPAHVMPAWLAHLTPWIDDEVSAEAWPGVIRRYAALARRWHCLDGAAWERARTASLLAIVIEARPHCPADERDALSAVDGVIEWLRLGAPEAGRAAVEEAAEEAVDAAAARASGASWAAALASWQAASASSATALASAAGHSVAAAHPRRGAAAARAAADRIATAVLGAIEAEIERSGR